MRTSVDADPTHVRGVLVLELAGAGEIARDALTQTEAGRLSALVARDLAALVPDASELDLAFAAAHFDPAEILRPGWPLHRRLDELAVRAPRSGAGARIIAFGADRDDTVPLPLRAEAELRGGRLRVLPFQLTGTPDAIAPVATAMEAVLLDCGMAQADTALLAQEAFSTGLEHARYFTALDLAAMTAMQYANQGLEQLWKVVEAALLGPVQDIVIDAAPEPLLRYVDGQARIALLDPEAWLAREPSGADSDPQRIERRFDAFQARQRQYAAVLQAHGIEVTFVHCRSAAEL